MMRRILAKLRNEAHRRRIRSEGFWFVDVPRTGSTSLKVQLHERFGSPFGKSDEAFAGAGLNLRDHQSAQEMRSFMKGDWPALWSFSFVRNPWDRFLSLYKFRRERYRHFGDEVSFERYVLSLRNPGYSFASKDSPYYRSVFYWNASDYLVDPDGKILVSDVFKFEERAPAFEKIASKIGIALDVESRIFRTESGGYRDHYTAEMRDLVGRHAWKDIQLFGYEF